jgi:hypothetical protein
MWTDKMLTGQNATGQNIDRQNVAARNKKIRAEISGCATDINKLSRILFKKF